MSQRERQRPQREIQFERPGSGSAGDPGVDELRADADRLLEAAEQAIARGLSGDSSAFLEANRQDGGQ